MNTSSSAKNDLTLKKATDYPIYIIGNASSLLIVHAENEVPSNWLEEFGMHVADSQGWVGQRFRNAAPIRSFPFTGEVSDHEKWLLDILANCDTGPFYGVKDFSILTTIPSNEKVYTHGSFREIKYQIMYAYASI